MNTFGLLTAGSVKQLEQLISRLLHGSTSKFWDRRKGLGNYREIRLYLFSCKFCTHPIPPIFPIHPIICKGSYKEPIFQEIIRYFL